MPRASAWLPGRDPGLEVLIVAEDEEVEVPRDRSGKPPSTPRDGTTNPFVREALKFLADLVEDSSTQPSDRIAAGKALLRGPSPARRKSKGQRKRAAVIYIEDALQAGSTGLAPPDSAAVQRRSTLLQFVEIMNDDQIRTSVRIRAARALLTEDSIAAADKRPAVIYLDALDRGL
jgi:hypothetical protein